MPTVASTSATIAKAPNRNVLNLILVTEAVCLSVTSHARTLVDTVLSTVDCRRTIRLECRSLDTRRYESDPSVAVLHRRRNLHWAQCVRSYRSVACVRAKPH